jgi:hypothetical protein
VETVLNRTESGGIGPSPQGWRVTAGKGRPHYTSGRTGDQLRGLRQCPGEAHTPQESMRSLGERGGKGRASTLPRLLSCRSHSSGAGCRPAGGDVGKPLTKARPRDLENVLSYIRGGVPEWLNGAVLKTAMRLWRIVGSNPTPSAMLDTNAGRRGAPQEEGLRGQSASPHLAVAGGATALALAAGGWYAGMPFRRRRQFMSSRYQTPRLLRTAKAAP